MPYGLPHLLFPGYILVQGRRKCRGFCKNVGRNTAVHRRAGRSLSRTPHLPDRAGQCGPGQPLLPLRGNSPPPAPTENHGAVRQNPATWFWWGEETQRNERAFAIGGYGGYEVCVDDVGAAHPGGPSRRTRGCLSNGRKDFFGKSPGKQKRTLDRTAKVSYNGLTIYYGNHAPNRGLAPFSSIHCRRHHLWHLDWKPVPILLSILRSSA